MEGCRTNNSLDVSKYPRKDTFGEMSDGIPSLANLAMGNKNQKNQGAVRGLEIVPATNLDPDRRGLSLADQKCRFKKLQSWFRLAGVSDPLRFRIVFK